MTVSYGKFCGGVRSRALRLAVFCFTAQIGLAAGSGASAQSITIVDPPQWREEQVVVMETRTVLRIAGFVSHPGGVARVRVNGLEATLRQDPDFPDSYTFEINIPPDSLKAAVTISVEPRTGEAMTRTFAIQMPPPVGAARAGGPIRPAAAAGPGEPEQIRGIANPWGGFKKRGILYGAAIAGGVVLSQLVTTETSEVCRTVGGGQDCFNQTRTEPSYQGLGLAAAGAGAGLLIIDAILTSRKAKSVSGPGSDDAGFHVEAPALTPTLNRIRLDLLRLRFQ